MTPAEASFRVRFRRPPEVVVSAPGRVNLIGEHTDYSLLPVLPFAIDRRLTVVAARGPRLEIHSQQHPRRPLIEHSSGEGWHRYVEAVTETIGFAGGVLAVVDSDLPDTGGLSSSSALAMAMTAALWRLGGRHPAADEVASAAAAAERLAGVESGEMDQTVIAHARAGHAMRIDFRPGRLPAFRHIPMPPEAAIVVAYSGEPAEKSGAARDAYNSRVVGGRVATVLLARRLGVLLPVPPVLGGVADHPGTIHLALELPAATTPSEAARSGAVDVGLLVDFAARSFPIDATVPVRAVAHHVLTEAARVGRAEEALVGEDLESLGVLLDESHASLRDFGASTPALDRLVQTMREAGALGARLTGAGFGGNAVALCRRADVEAVLVAARHVAGGPAFEVRPGPGLAYGT